MSKLTEQQRAQLLQMVRDAKQDCLDCDGCFEHLAEFTELELLGQPIPEAMQVVQLHLEQCPCCQAEHSMLIDALQAIDAED